MRDQQPVADAYVALPNANANVAQIQTPRPPQTRRMQFKSNSAPMPEVRSDPMDSYVSYLPQAVPPLPRAGTHLPGKNPGFFFILN